MRGALASMWLGLLAKKSISGTPKRLHSLTKTSLLNVHSVSALKLRDRSFAETFDAPGICAAERQFPRSRAQDQMSPAMPSQGKDLPPPDAIDITYCNLVVWDNPYVLALRVNEKRSKTQLHWQQFRHVHVVRCLSFRPQTMRTRGPWSSTLTLSEASEVRVKSGTQWSKDLYAEGSDSIH